MPYQPASSKQSNAHHSSFTRGEDILSDAHEFIPNKLYFISLANIPQQHHEIHFFSTDQLLVYINFYADFGPLNIGQLMKFCQMLTEKLRNPLLSNKKICFYSSNDKVKRNNAAYLICCFMVIVFKKSPDEAYAPFVVKPPSPEFLAFRDAGYGPATYFLSVLDCVRGLHKGLTVGLLHIEDFDIEEYDFYEKVENGDMNWLCDKFLALASPKDDETVIKQQQQRQMMMQQQSGFSSYTANLFSSVVGYGNRSLLPSQTKITSTGKTLLSAYVMGDLIKVLKEKGVVSIVRLNNNVYDKTKFIEAGIEHIELYFPDGSTPPDGILKKFLDMMESREGAIAVHCKAGLGRTGSLIGAYLMKHYKMTACETIAYLRIMRPGSVVGPQQNWLESMQTKLWRMHPQATLPLSISLLRPSTFYTSSRRFHIPGIEAYFATPRIRASSVSVNDSMDEGEDGAYDDGDEEGTAHYNANDGMELKHSQRKAATKANANIMIHGNKKSDKKESNRKQQQQKYYTQSQIKALLARKDEPEHSSNDYMDMESSSSFEKANPGAFVLDEYSIPIQPRKGGKRGVIDEELYVTRQPAEHYESVTEEYYGNNGGDRYQAYVSASASITNSLGHTTPNNASARGFVLNGSSKVVPAQEKNSRKNTAQR